MDAGFATLWEPMVQYGFAGLCVILIGVIVWLIKQLLRVLERNNEVIQSQVAVSTEVKNLTRDEMKLVRQLYNKVISRPCIARGEREGLGE